MVVSLSEMIYILHVMSGGIAISLVYCRVAMWNILD